MPVLLKLCIVGSACEEWILVGDSFGAGDTLLGVQLDKVVDNSVLTCRHTLMRGKRVVVVIRYVLNNF